MKLKFIAFFCGLLFLSLLTSSFHEGPANYLGYDCTGANGINFNHFAYAGCGNTALGCHNTTLSNNVRIELDSAGIPVKIYHPGRQYTVKISATNGISGSLLPYFGFQMASVRLLGAGDTNAVQAGIWDSINLPARVRYEHAGPYTAPLDGTSGWNIPIVEHGDTIPVSTGSGTLGSIYTESIHWTAPDSGIGAIVLFGALNTVNGDGLNTGDYNQAAIPDTVLEGNRLPDGIIETAGLTSLKVGPVMMSDQISVSFFTSHGGFAKIDLLSLDGKKARVLNPGVFLSGGNYTASFNVSDLPEAVYLLRIDLAGNVNFVKVVKQ